MSDYSHEDFATPSKHMKGGIRFDAFDNYKLEDNEDELKDEDYLFGGFGEEDVDNDMTVEDITSKMYNTTTGGELDDGENTYTIAHSSVGHTGGRYVSKTASSAAKKAGTTIFKMMKGKTSVKSKVFVVLERTRRGKCKKYYAYNLEHIRLGNPKVVDITVNGKVSHIKYNYKTTAKKAELPDEYVELNKDAKKKFAAAKKTQKVKESGDAPKRKPKAAKKSPKAAKPAKAAKTAKAATIDAILKSIVSPPKVAKKAKKTPKAPKAAKKSPKDTGVKKPRAKKTTGGGYCSFF